MKLDNFISVFSLFLLPSVLATDYANCVLPPLSSSVPSKSISSSNTRASATSEFPAFSEKCSLRNTCCAGFKCDYASSTCVADLSYFDLETPADFAATANLALRQLDALSNGLMDVVGKAAEAVSVCNHQMNLISYHDRNMVDAKDDDNVDDDFKTKADEFFKRLNSTLSADIDQFKDFAMKTQTDFKDYFKGVGDDFKSMGHDFKEKFKDLDKNGNDDEQVPASENVQNKPGFDYKQYMPNKSEKKQEKNQDSAQTFDWKKYIPKGVKVDPNEKNAKNEKNEKNGKSRKLKATEDKKDSSAQAAGFDWSVYVPSGAGAKGNNAGMGSTGQFDWSKYVPNTTSGKMKPSDSDDDDRKLNKKKKKKHEDESTSKSSSSSASPFDYSQYVPKNVAQYGKGNQQGDLFAKHLEANYRALSDLFNSADLHTEDADMQKIKKFIAGNTKDLSDKAIMVAEEAAKTADALSRKFKVAAANLKESAEKLKEQAEKEPEDRDLSFGVVNVEAVKAPQGVGMGRYFLIALLVAFFGVSVIALFNRRRQGYHHL